MQYFCRVLSEEGKKQRRKNREKEKTEMNMKKTMLLLVLTAMTLAVNAQLPTQQFTSRGMWASVNTKDDASLGDYKQHNNKLLVSWRMLPTDTWDTSFLLYTRSAALPNGMLVRKTPKPVTATNFQTSLPSAQIVYYLLPGDYFGTDSPKMSVGGDEALAMRQAALDSLLIDDRIVKDKLPYLEIALQATDDCSDYPDIIKYQANDCSVADLDGDGQMEVVVKRLLTTYNSAGEITSSSEGAGDSDRRARHIVVWDAYKLDGSLLWRVKSGPNIIPGNSSSVMLGDLDGDGCAEFVTKTGEGTVFGDGKEMGDTDGDGITDYRNNWGGHYTGDKDGKYGGPEYFSVIDGKTGRELARANFIARGPEGQTPAQWTENWAANSNSWGDNYWKRANSLRMGLASFKGQGLQIFLGRGVYARTVVEGWEYTPTADETTGLDGTLTRMWKFDSAASGGKDRNKDGKLNSAYAGQGNHAFNVADLDGDGKDEVMYGSCAFDDDGTGLWTTGLGHGDASHVGRFLPDREGMQVYHCLESGVTEVALHDAKDGTVIWKIVAPTAGDQGRCMTADVDPASPGYEFWKYGNELYTQNGTELYNSEGNRKKESSANAGIWFDGYLNRQMIDGNTINSFAHGRTFTMYRYDISFNNSTKSNPGWYGDFLGDWREEVIVPDATKLKNIKVFSTWYPSEYKLPYLMSDHTYYMQCLHENVGYNQPTNIGSYYLGSDMDFNKVPLQEPVSGIRNVDATTLPAIANDSRIFDLSGRCVNGNHNGNNNRSLKPGIYVSGGRKYVVK
jgi:rhamnogalacturonan endolyase